MTDNIITGVLIVLVAIDSFFTIKRVSLLLNKQVHFTKLDYEIITDALDAYQAFIVKNPERLELPLDRLSIFVQELDKIKDKIEKV